MRKAETGAVLSVALVVIQEERAEFGWSEIGEAAGHGTGALRDLVRATMCTSAS